MIQNQSGIFIPARDVASPVTVKYIDSEINKELTPSVDLIGDFIRDPYKAEALEIPGYQLIEMPENAVGTYTDTRQTVTFIYDPITYNLTLRSNPEEGGNPTAINQQLIASGTTQINANPAEGYRFVSWHVDGFGSSVDNKTSEIATFIMGEVDTIVTAEFELEEKILTFDTVPSTLQFEDVNISSSLTIIERTNDLDIAIKDTRREESNNWSIYLSITEPLTSENNHKLSTEAFIFKDKQNNILPLSEDTVLIHSGITPSGETINNLSWSKDEGILLYLNPSDALATAYTATIRWVLTDAPI